MPGTSLSKPAELAKANQRSANWHWFVGVVLFIVLGFIALVILYASAGRVERMASIGDAAAPLVSLVSLAAVGVAVWSIDLQRQQIMRQDSQIEAQQKAITEQLTLQRDALDHQRSDANERTRTKQHEALRAAYGPFFVTAQRFLKSLEEYQIYMRGSAFELEALEAYGHVEDIRRDANDTRTFHNRLRSRCHDLHEAFQQHAMHAELTDPDSTRTAILAKLRTSDFQLVPSVLHDPSTLQLWDKVISFYHYRLMLRVEKVDLWVHAAVLGRELPLEELYQTEAQEYLNNLEAEAELARQEVKKREAESIGELLVTLKNQVKP